MLQNMVMYTLKDTAPMPSFYQCIIRSIHLYPSLHIYIRTSEIATCLSILMAGNSIAIFVGSCRFV